MNFDLSDEQIMLRDSLRKMLADQSSVQMVRKMENDPTGFPAPLWTCLAEMGINGLNLPEEYGGAAMGTVDVALVYEEFGRALSPAPHLETCVVSAGILARAGSAEQKQEWLPRIAAGETVLTPALIEYEGSFGPEGVQLKAEVGRDGYRVNGTKFFVSFAKAADRLITLVRRGPGESGIDILLVDPTAEGITLTKTESLAWDARYEVRFYNAFVPLSDRVGAEGSGWQTWEAVRFDALIPLAAWSVGCGQQALELATTYAKDRIQFDRPIGSFQSVAHQLADAATGLAGARLMTYEAAWAKDVGRPYTRLAAMAHLNAGEAGRFSTRTAQQVFGGIGFTNDIDVQLFHSRAMQNQVAWIDGRMLEESVGGESIAEGR